MPSGIRTPKAAARIDVVTLKLPPALSPARHTFSPVQPRERKEEQWWSKGGKEGNKTEFYEETGKNGKLTKEEEGGEGRFLLQIHNSAKKLNENNRVNTHHVTVSLFSTWTAEYAAAVWDRSLPVCLLAALLNSCTTTLTYYTVITINLPQCASAVRGPQTDQMSSVILLNTEQHNFVW